MCCLSAELAPLHVGGFLYQMSHSPGIFSILWFPLWFPSFTFTTLCDGLSSYLQGMQHCYILPGPNSSVGHWCKLSWPHSFCISHVYNPCRKCRPVLPAQVVDWPPTTVVIMTWVSVVEPGSLSSSFWVREALGGTVSSGSSLYIFSSPKL